MTAQEYNDLINQQIQQSAALQAQQQMAQAYGNAGAAGQGYGGGAGGQFSGSQVYGSSWATSVSGMTGTVPWTKAVGHKCPWCGKEFSEAEQDDAKEHFSTHAKNDAPPGADEELWKMLETASETQQ